MIACTGDIEPCSRRHESRAQCHDPDAMSGGIPESLPEDVDGRAAITESIVAATMLKRAATLEDVGNVAAFVASDRARSMTAATANISCGTLID